MTKTLAISDVRNRLLDLPEELKKRDVEKGIEPTSTS